MSTKILVIEDDGSVRDSLVELLNAEGHTACGAESGLTGLRMASEFNPDLIICDIMMPDLDGFGVLEQLQADPATAVIPFIFLTAKAERLDQRRGMGQGADDYVTKPFTRQDILNTVSRRLIKRDQIDKRYASHLDDLVKSIALALPHELRTPLSGIKTGASVIVETLDTMSLPDIKSIADIIYQSSERLEHLIVNYLTYAELEIVLNDPGRLQLLRAITTHAPRPVIEQAAYTAADKAGRLADLSLDLDDSPVRMADQHLTKLTLELTDNALKFSKPGTPVELISRAAAGHYILTVTDHGRGLRPDQIAYVGAYMQFERKLHEQQGSGLGLTIARRLAEVYGGELTIDSVYGSSTTVQVTLLPG